MRKGKCTLIPSDCTKYPYTASHQRPSGGYALIPYTERQYKNYM